MFFFDFEGMTWFGNPLDFPNQVVENCLFLLGWRHLLVPVPHPRATRKPGVIFFIVP